MTVLRPEAAHDMPGGMAAGAPARVPAGLLLTLGILASIKAHQ